MRSVAVLGAGQMGHGLAQLAAMAGDRVAVYDIGEPQLDRARSRIEASLKKLAASDHLVDSELVQTRLSYLTDIELACEDVDVIIEAVPECIDMKQQVLKIAANTAASDALIACNTSQLSITKIASVLGDAAERTIGMHFFNPAVIMRLCEVVRGMRTSSETLERAIDLAECYKKEVVVCQKDSPGFITTRAYAALRQECIKILDEGLATAEDIDKAMRLGFNFPLGPLELSDLNGVDIYYDVVSSLAKVHGERFRPSITLDNMISSDRLGRKTGVGFYRYGSDGHRLREGEG